MWFLEKKRNMKIKDIEYKFNPYNGCVSGLYTLLFSKKENYKAYKKIGEKLQYLKNKYDPLDISWDISFNTNE